VTSITLGLNAHAFLTSDENIAQAVVPATFAGVAMNGK
jgi:hypothetical protein